MANENTEMVQRDKDEVEHVSSMPRVAPPVDVYENADEELQEAAIDLGATDLEVDDDDVGKRARRAEDGAQGRRPELAPPVRPRCGGQHPQLGRDGHGVCRQHRRVHRTRGGVVEVDRVHGLTVAPASANKVAISSMSVTRPTGTPATSTPAPRFRPEEETKRALMT